MTERKEISWFLPWVIWGLSASFYCYGFFQRVAPSVMVEELMTDFSVNAAVLGNLSAFYFYAYAGLQLPIGLLVDRWGARIMLVGAAILCAGGSLLFAKADNLTGAYIGRLMIGAGAGVTWVGTLKLATQWMPPKRFALVTGMTLMLGMAGAVAGQAPLAAAVSAFGWRGTMVVASGVALAFAVLIWWVVKDGREVSQSNVVGSQSAELLRGLRMSLKNPQSWFAAFYGGTMTASMLAFAGLWGVPYLMQAYGLDRPAAAASTSLMLIGWAIGAPFTGWISDHIGLRRLPMLLSSVITLSLVATVLYMPDLPLNGARVLLFLAGVFNGGMVVCFAVGREHNKPETAGATIGFINMIVMSSGALFQPLIGWLLDLNWDGAMDAGNRVYSIAAYEKAFISLIVCGVIAITMALLIRETRCKNVFAD